MWEFVFNINIINTIWRNQQRYVKDVHVLCSRDSELPVWTASCTANQANRHLLVWRGQFLHVAPSKWQILTTHGSLWPKVCGHLYVTSLVSINNLCACTLWPSGFVLRYMKNVFLLFFWQPRFCSCGEANFSNTFRRHKSMQSPEHYTVCDCERDVSGVLGSCLTHEKHVLRWHLMRTAHCSVTVTVRTAVFIDKPSLKFGSEYTWGLLSSPLITHGVVDGWPFSLKAPEMLR